MKLRELTFADAPMFDRVMADEEVCRKVVEVILDVKIDKVVYHNIEQALEPVFGGRGVRLDAYLKDSEAVYDIEMQAYEQLCLDRRFRYYQSAIDANLLRKGEGYDLLPDSYIVFICLSDPYGRGLARYDFERVCSCDPPLLSECGSHWITLNASAHSLAENTRLRSLLEYIASGIIANDPLVKLIAGRVSEANRDRKWVDHVYRGMTLEENAAMQVSMAERVFRKKGLEEGRAEGMAEGKAEGEKRYGKLIARLLSEGRTDDVARTTEDAQFRAMLYDEFGL